MKSKGRRLSQVLNRRDERAIPLGDLLGSLRDFTQMEPPAARIELAATVEMYQEWENGLTDEAKHFISYEIKLMEWLVSLDGWQAEFLAAAIRSAVDHHLSKRR